MLEILMLKLPSNFFCVHVNERGHNMFISQFLVVQNSEYVLFEILYINLYRKITSFVRPPETSEDKCDH